MKKQLLLLVMMLLPLVASAHDIEVANDDGKTIYYNLTNFDTELEVTYCGSSPYNTNDYEGIVVIPPEVTYMNISRKVTKIGFAAFYSCSNLSSVTIPNTVNKLESYAFWGCTALASIDIPNSIISIGNQAFENCINLNSITIPLSVTDISYSVFSNCTGLKSINLNCSSIDTWFSGLTSLENVKLGQNVTIIKENAFKGCSNLSSVEVSNSIISIGKDAFSGTSWYEKQPDGAVYAGKILYKYKGEMPDDTIIEVVDGTVGIADYAFADYKNLISISFPESVVNIGNSAFSFCSKLSSVSFPDNIETIGSGAFYGTPWSQKLPQGLVYVGKVLYKYNDAMPENTNIEIQDGTRSISSEAFLSCTNLKSITIPNSVIEIGRSAFSGCSGLTTVTIPNSVINIDYQAFYGCTGLTSVELLDGVQRIGDGVFSNCIGLSSVIFPNSVISIGEKVLENCTDLVSVTIGNGMNRIGNYACLNCTNLNSLIIYGDINIWGYRPFKDCPNISNLTFGCKNVSDWFSGVYGFNSVENVTLLEGVEIINEKAFYESKNLKNVSFPNSLRTIKATAFANCYSLNTAILNEGLLSIGTSAFAGCSLKNISIPSSVVELGYGAFDCASLNSLIIEESDETLTVDGRILSSDNSNVSKIVLNRNLQPKTEVNRFMPFYNQKKLNSVSIGKKVTFIDPDYFEGCFKIGSLIFENGEEELAIGERARVYTPFSKCPIVFLHLGRNIKEGYMPAPLQISSPFTLSIGKGVTNFGTFFWNCTVGNIEVETDNTKYDSRDNCNAIIETASNTIVLGSMNTNIPSSIVKIGDNAFKGCAGLNSITIPNSITSISQSAFVGCDNLIVTFLCPNIDSWFMNNTSIKGVVFADGVLSIKSNAFSGCTGLTSVNFGNSVTSIGEKAFRNCRALSSVTIPQNVTSLGDKVFSECSGLRNVTILCPYIGSAFSGNTSLTEVVLGDNVISIYGGAFSGCSGLTSISIPNSVTNIGNSVFENCTGLTNVIIPDSVTMIGGSAFSGCKNLTSIIIGAKVNTIGSQAFRGCSSLTNVVIPNCVENIYSSSFQGCSSLSSVIIEDGESPLMYFEGDHYRGCPLSDVYIGRNVNYTTASPFVTNKESIISLKFGEQVTEIGVEEFYGLKNLTSIALPNSLKKIGPMAFYGCEGLTTLTIPSSVTEIGRQAFDLCRGLKTLSFEDGEEELAFTAEPNFINNSFCNSPLEKIYLGRNIIYTNVSPFSVMESIKELTLGSKVTMLSDGVFAGCPNLKDVYSNSETVPTTGENVFTESYLANATLHVPYSLYDEYRVTYPWSKFGNMINDEGKYNLFYMVDDVEYKKYVVNEGDAITPETEPTEEGYTFSGWSEIPETMPSHDVTVTGSFTVNKYKLIYKVDGEVIKSYDVEFGATITPEIEPTKEGYTFSGWSEIPATMPAHDVIVTGTFTQETGIDQIMSNQNSKAMIFTIGGKRVDNLKKGLNVIRMKDGTMCKVVVR